MCACVQFSGANASRIFPTAGEEIFIVLCRFESYFKSVAFKLLLIFVGESVIV